MGDEEIEKLYDGLMNNNPSAASASYNNEFGELDDQLLNQQYNPFSSGLDVQQGKVAPGSEYLTQYDDAFENDVTELAAQRQSWGSKAASGLGRFGTKVASEVAKMPGVAGGILIGAGGQVNDLITGKDNTDFVQTAFNNTWIKTIQGIEDAVKEELLPVYIKKAVSEGNLWDNITSIDFWATEGADGLGYMASMMVPGAIVNRFSLGSKFLGAGDKIAKMAAKSDKFAKNLKAVGYTNKSLDVGAVTIANTLFEAGAESKGAMDGLEAKAESYLHEANAFLKEGLITQQEYDVRKIEYDKMKANISNVGQNIALANIGILSVSNFSMAKMLYGTKGITKNATDIINKGGNKLNKLDDFKRFGKANLKKQGTNVAKNIATEGFYEEGMQSATETYFSENYDKGMSEYLQNISSSYLDMLGTTEGQKAIFLGAVLGGGMSIYQTNVDNKNQIKDTNKLIDSANETLESFSELMSSDVYITNNEGEIEYKEDENGDKKPTIDPAKIIEKIKGHAYLNEISARYDIAQLTGNKEESDSIINSLITDLLMPFTINSDKLGGDILKKQLEESPMFENIRENNPKFIEETLNKFDALKEAYDTVSIIAPKLVKNNIVSDNDSDVVDFYNRSIAKYLRNTAQSHDAKINIKKVKNSLSKLEDIFSYDELSDYINEYQETIDKNKEILSNYKDSKSNEWRKNKKNKEIKSDELSLDQFSTLKDHHDKISSLKNRLKKLAEDKKDSFNNKKIQKEFKDYSEERAKVRKAAEKDKEVEEALNSIKSATTKEEVEAIVSPVEEANSQIGEAKIRKIEEIKQANAKKDEATKTASEKEEIETLKAAADKIKYIEENFSVGEFINTEGLKLPEGMDADSVKITAINEMGGVSVIDDNGMTATLSKETLFNKHSIESDTRTEGGTNTNPEVKTNGDTKSKANEFEDKDQPRLIITNNKKKHHEVKKFDSVSDEALDAERTPVNKEGQEKGIEVNNGTSNKNNSSSKTDIEKRRQEELSKVKQNITKKENIPENITDIKSSHENKKNLENILQYIRRNYRHVAYGLSGDVAINFDLYKDYFKDVPTILDKLQNELRKSEISELNILYKQGIRLYSESNQKDTQQSISESTIIEDENRINAKYDAELAALGSEQQTSGFTNPNWNKALQMFEANDFSDLEFLINHLPLNVVLAESVYAHLETLPNIKPTNSENRDNWNYADVFLASSYHIRKTIIKELANGATLSSIKVKIAGQYNGQLQVDKNEDGTVPENNVKDLYEFQGETSNIKSTDIYTVLSDGSLSNENDDRISTNRGLSPGEIYINIKTARGESFPLKLNIKKINKEEAELLYELYSFRVDNREGGKAQLLSELPQELQSKIKTLFTKELELFEKNGNPFSNTTIKDIVDFLIWDATDNLKTRVKLYNDNIRFGTSDISKEEFNTEKGKADFIYFLLDNDGSSKRHQIRTKRTKLESTSALTIQNPLYLSYLIDNGILNTNAVVNEPTFQGRTTMYLGKDTVLVDGKLSEFNADVPKSFSSRLLGTESQLHNELPNMAKKEFKLGSSKSDILSTLIETLKAGDIIDIEKLGIKLSNKIMGTKLQVLNKDADIIQIADEKGNVHLLHVQSEYKDEKSVSHARVSTLKDTITDAGMAMYNASKRGNVVDELVRLFFTTHMTFDQFAKDASEITSKENKKKTLSKIEFEGDFFNKLFDILEVFKKDFDKKGYTIYANSNTLHGKIGEKLFAGTMDLLAYDNINENWVIIDVKTQSSSRLDSYNNTNDQWNYKGKDEIQQNAYKHLFEKMNNVSNTKLLILPLTVRASNSSNTKYSTISTVKGLYLEVNSNKTIEELVDKDKLINKKEPTPSKAASKPETFMTEGTFEFEGNSYILLDSGDLMTHDEESNANFVDNPSLIIEKYNNTNPDIKIKTNKVEKPLISQKNVVPLPKKEVIPGIKKDYFDKLDDYNVQILLTNLMKSYSATYSKDLRILAQTNESMQEKAYKIVEYLINKGISKKDIITKCNIK
jgi:hypothetical protein